MKKKILFALIGLLVLFLVSRAVQKVQELRREAAGQIVELSLDTAGVTSFEQGETIDASLKLDSQGLKVSGVSLIIKFDPQILSVENSSPEAGEGKPFTEVFINEVNNDKGEVVLTIFADKPDSQLAVGSSEFPVLLASFVFKGKNDGISEVEIEEASYEITSPQGEGNLLTLEDFVLASFRVGEAEPTVSPTATPIPTQPPASPSPTPVSVCDCQGASRQQREDGDYNCDDRVDSIDFQIWYDHYIKGLDITEDFNCDGKPGIGDFLNWLLSPKR